MHRPCTAVPSAADPQRRLHDALGRFYHPGCHRQLQVHPKENITKRRKKKKKEHFRAQLQMNITTQRRNAPYSSYVFLRVFDSMLPSLCPSHSLCITVATVTGHLCRYNKQIRAQKIYVLPTATCDLQPAFVLCAHFFSFFFLILFLIHQKPRGHLAAPVSKPPSSSMARSRRARLAGLPTASVVKTPLAPVCGVPTAMT